MELEEVLHFAEMPGVFGEGCPLQGLQEFVVRGYHDTGRILRERQEKRIVDDRTRTGGDLRCSRHGVFGFVQGDGVFGELSPGILHFYEGETAPAVLLPESVPELRLYGAWGY